MKIQTHPPVFDFTQPNKPLVLLYLNDLTFRLNARFFSILNGKGEFFARAEDVHKIPSKFHQNKLNHRQSLNYAIDNSSKQTMACKSKGGHEKVEKKTMVR